MSGATFTKYLAALGVILLLWVINHARLIKKGGLELKLPQKYTIHERIIVAFYFMGVPMILALLVVLAAQAHRLASAAIVAVIVNGMEPALKRLKHVPF